MASKIQKWKGIVVKIELSTFCSYFLFILVLDYLFPIGIVLLSYYKPSYKDIKSNKRADHSKRKESERQKAGSYAFLAVCLLILGTLR